MKRDPQLPCPDCGCYCLQSYLRQYGGTCVGCSVKRNKKKSKDDMTATTRFIVDAIESGYQYHDKPIAKSTENAKWYACIGEVRWLLHETDILLDPAAWEAVGKVRGWKFRFNLQGHVEWETKDGIKQGSHVPQWNYYMHCLIDALCDGKSIEQYLASIE